MPNRQMAAMMVACWLALGGAAAFGSAELTVDFGQTIGAIRPLHGGNCGPINYGGMVDLSRFHRELAIPFTRLHDCHWPNPDVVDIHTIFPDSAADPEQPASYHFERTDDYIRAILDAGSEVVFRLGESIEHTPKQYYVHPPRDPEKWAAVCVGIIRHYNEGWANGHHWNLRHWEIWNEPDVRPQMWTGSDEDYFRLYATAAKAIKNRFPGVLVGGPALGNIGQLAGGKLSPSAFLTNFLAHCRRERAPLDFFSWHCYTPDPAELSLRATGVRRVLDDHSFSKTQSYLDEWNYLPRGDWRPMLSGGEGIARQKFFDAIGGPEGGAFTACALLELQDSPVDMANYYTAEIQGFGLFSFYGVPKKTFYSMKAFKGLADAPVRVAARGQIPGRLALCAGLNAARTEAVVLISNFSSPESHFELVSERLPWAKTRYSMQRVDADSDLAEVQAGELRGTEGVVPCRLPAPAVALVKLRAIPAEPAAAHK